MDRVAQFHIEQEVGARLGARYWRWCSYEFIYSAILLWSQLNRHRYDGDTEGINQINDMYHAVAAECERHKAEECGYEVDDVYFYSIPYLKELVAQVCAGVNSTRLNEAYADVQQALYSLVNEGSRNQILNYHAGEMVSDEAYDQALGKLQEVLGGQRPKGLRNYG